MEAERAQLVVGAVELGAAAAIAFVGDFLSRPVSLPGPRSPEFDLLVPIVEQLQAESQPNDPFRLRIGLT